MNHQHYLESALMEAQKAGSMGEVPIGAVVVLEGEIIGRGHNLKESTQSAIAHAEVLAIEEACKKMKSWRLEKAILYSTLEPCPMCAGAIFQARIEQVVFGAKDLKWGALGTVVDLFSKKMFNHVVKVEYFPNESCSQILTAFFKAKREQA